MIEIQKKKEIFDSLKADLPFGEYFFSQISSALRNAGYRFEDFGYSKAKQLIQDLPEFLEILTEGHPATSPAVSFRDWKVRENKKTKNKKNDKKEDKKKELTNSVKREIYEALKKEFPFGEHSFPSVSTALRHHGFIYSDFGFSKAKNFLLALPEYLSVITEGHPANSPAVRFLEWKEKKPEKENPEKNNAEKQKTVVKESSLTAEIKEQAYLALKEKLDFGSYPFQSVNNALIESGFDYKQFGFSKAKQLVLELSSFLTLETKGHEPTDPYVRFNEIAGMTKKSVSRNNEKESHDYSRYPIDQALLKKNFADWVNFPQKNLQILSEMTDRDPAELPEILSKDFRKAVKNGSLQFHEEKLNFPLTLRSREGRRIYIVIKPAAPQRAEGKPWFFHYVHLDRSSSELSQNDAIPAGKQIEKFAALGKWSDFLADLAAMALPETWDFDESRGSYEILRNYITFTFARLQKEDKIEVSSDGSMAVFNTGLVDRHYNDIFACFTPNNSGRPAWKFAGFCTDGSHGLGKDLNRLFNTIPQPAEYFSRLEDLLYDPAKKLKCDYVHILIENIDRLPLHFLRNHSYGFTEAISLINTIRNSSGDQKEEAYDQFRILLKDNSRLFNRMMMSLEMSKDLALKMIRWNFKTAIPSYYPSADTMSLMLPLYLDESEEVDCVLVVELLDSGNYQGQTILTPRQAYVDARLICRPGDDWLTSSASIQGKFIR